MESLKHIGTARIRRLPDYELVESISTLQNSDAGGCVLYVMSSDQRVRDNQALLAAQDHALRLGLPLAVVFCLLPKAGFRAREHYQFMLDGLQQIENDLATYSIPFMMLIGDPYDRLMAAFYHVKPSVVYFDFNPLRGARALQTKLSQSVSFPCYVVDTHNIVPVWRASDKLEVGARTLRPKIHRQLNEYLVAPGSLHPHPHRWHGPIMQLHSLSNQVQEVLDDLPANGQHLAFESGEAAALRMVDDFIAYRLRGYARTRNDPTIDGTSNLSPYLHFGQLSSLRVVLCVEAAVSADETLRTDADVLIEEMVIRKELSDNWCLYNADYDKLEGAARWAQATLQKHSSDPREHIYSSEQLTNAQTHDPAWNAAQRQLVATGKMHGYMRMYWAKKVLEWSSSPQQALGTLIYLNDFYSIDGGDPNGYAGIMWSIAGVHDRPWGERPVYGTIGSMVYTGLKRKFTVRDYENRWVS